MNRAKGFVSDPDHGVYFWSHSDATRHYSFSTHPHALLPYYCERHRWYSDVPCRACADRAPLRLTKLASPLPSAQLEFPWS